MHTFLQIIRALKTPFKVCQNTAKEFIFEVESAELDDITSPATLRFVRPSHAWASEWDEIGGAWRDVRGFSLPEQGEINEARSAYKRAFEAQLAVFTGKPPTG